MGNTGLSQFLRDALAEDVGPGDVTTEACVDPHLRGSASIVAKQDLVVCGQEAAQQVFGDLAARRGQTFAYTPTVADGTAAVRGDVVARLDGPLAVILTGERLALNLLMKLSGIATNVRAYVDAAGPGGPRVVDTRKTTPLLREFEKYAVRCGGGRNHRHALYDGVLIKDNHIVAAGGITAAVARARDKAHHLLRIEVEVATLDELDEALGQHVEAILLDNMDDATLREAVKRARASAPRVVLEASGNMTPERIAAIRHFGLDLVSAGGLVHQARWVDLSLRIDARA
jgi:nicotinate-nucleotide pyrophosphorylase (carboxylating)